MSLPRFRILAVDDEPLQRRLLQRLLGEVYDLDVAGSCREALDLLRQRPYDLLLTDLEMPEMKGIKLIETANAIWPSMPCLLVSGSIDENSPEVRDNDIPFIAKPYRSYQLLNKVASLLQAGDDVQQQPPVPPRVESDKTSG